MEALVAKNLAVYEPPKQTRSILLYWRLPEEWAEVLYDWVRLTAILSNQLSLVITDAYRRPLQVGS